MSVFIAVVPNLFLAAAHLPTQPSCGTQNLMTDITNRNVLFRRILYHRVKNFAAHLGFSCSILIRKHWPRAGVGNYFTSGATVKRPRSAEGRIF